MCSSDLATSALETAKDAGVAVDEEVLDRSRSFQKNNINVENNQVATESAAGVVLYSVSGSARASAKETAEAKEIIKKAKQEGRIQNEDVNVSNLRKAGLSDEKISKQFADVGAQMGGGVDDDKASFKLRTLSSARERDKALDLYINILQKPDFPEDVLAREKARVIAGLKEAATQPETIADKAYTKALFGSHPYGFDAEPEHIQKIDRYDVLKFYKAYYGAQGAVIALMGDMSREQAEQIAEKIALDLPKADKPADLPTVTYPSAASEQRIAHPATQAHILMGYPGMKRGDPDFFPLYVGNYVLGEIGRAHV